MTQLCLECLLYQTQVFLDTHIEFFAECFVNLLDRVGAQKIQQFIQLDFSVAGVGNILQICNVIFDFKIFQFVDQRQLPEQQESPVREINIQQPVAILHEGLLDLLTDGNDILFGFLQLFQAARLANYFEIHFYLGLGA